MGRPLRNDANDSAKYLGPDVSVVPSVTDETSRLRGRIRYREFFALAFGTIVGSGWLILLGGWLGAAAPGGSIVGFLLGGLVVCLAAGCFAELASRFPRTGADFLYALSTIGESPAFMIGWFLLLYLVSMAIFEGLALSIIFQTLFPIAKPIALYVVFGTPVTLVQAALGVAGASLILRLNYKGIDSAAQTQVGLTYCLLIVAGLVLVMSWHHGSVSNALPLFTPVQNQPWWLGSAWIFAGCAYLLNGFQASAMAIEERDPSVSVGGIALVTVVAVASAVIFYCLVVLCSSSAIPWRRIADAKIAMVEVSRSLPGGKFWTFILLFVGGLSVVKTWNGVSIMAARLMVAMARARFLPGRFALTNSETGVPRTAVLAVYCMNVAGLFLGQGAIEPLLSMCSMALTPTLTLYIYMVFRARRADRGSRSAFALPGGNYLLAIGATGTCAMGLAAFSIPLMRSGPPIDLYLFGAWGLLGVAAWNGIRWRMARTFRANDP